MIRINLLGLPKSKKIKRPTITIGGAPNVGVIIAAILVITAAGNYYYYWTLNSKGTQLQRQLETANAENKKLSAVKARYVERQKQYDAYDHRVKVIHQLQAAQQGPLSLLDTISTTVNSTDAVWLTSMTEDANNINLAGTALSANSVANLITALKKSNYFKSVEMKESIQDDRVTDMQAFQFTLVCEKQKS
ncbi:MAG TPA: PilN domain-containing protein [Terriglobales bacterium]|nr:PilN domain-containing protein [Terriglobales bacterium]